MKFKLAFLIGLSALSFASHATASTKIAWLHLNLMHTYQDSSVACSAIKPGGDLYFSAEVENGHATKVVLSNFPYVWPYEPIYKSILLGPEDLKNLELFQDKKGRYWIRNLTLNEPSLRWIMYWASERYSYCPLPQLLSTLAPAPIKFEFETDTILEELYLSYSQPVNVEGLRRDGQPYKAKMRFTQREYKRAP